jgi:hypothetical protein
MTRRKGKDGGEEKRKDCVTDEGEEEKKQILFQDDFVCERRL